jgi:hypothetical protein
VVAQPPSQGAGDRERQIGSRGRVQASVLEPPRDGAGLGERGVQGHGRVERAVHGHHPVGTDELVQLQVVDVPVRSLLGPVQHDEYMAGIHVHLGHGVAAGAVLGGAGMDAEPFGEHGSRDGVPLWHVDPQDGVVSRQ